MITHQLVLCTSFPDTDEFFRLHSDIVEGNELVLNAQRWELQYGWGDLSSLDNENTYVVQDLGVNKALDNPD